jgi:arabinofuranosyltransferase
MSPLQRFALALVFIAASALLLAGWDAFWFLTDDAFIAFRYVSNSQAGLGYVWNPPPFLPVEGYTSFLWVVLLDWVWSLTGVEPPASANVLALVSSFASLGLTAFAAVRICLSAGRGPGTSEGAGVGRALPALVGLALLLVVGNRVFLAASSSGLESALFNALVLAWLLAAFARWRPGRRVAALAALATLIALTRPDGLLFGAATAAIATAEALRAPAGQRLRVIAGALPLLGIGAHLAWRLRFYGDWLPNTYYAKTTGIWLAAGWRYLASFTLEFALWFAVPVVAVAAFRWLRGGSMARLAGAPALAALTVLAHAGYYTVFVGGDHFEFRVYGPLVPALALALLWAAVSLPIARRTALLVLALQLALGSFIPWTHWQNARAQTAETGEIALFRPVAPALPAGLRWYARPFDEMQAWLIERMVCMRHNEHLLFWRHLERLHPPREVGRTLFEGVENPVVLADSVGIPGWVFPTAHVIDAFGLNDYVIARTPIPPDTPRRMAHERRAPAGYIEAFRPLLRSAGAGSLERLERAAPLSDADIVAIEARWRAQVNGE